MQLEFMKLRSQERKLPQISESRHGSSAVEESRIALTSSDQSELSLEIHTNGSIVITAISKSRICSCSCRLLDNFI